MAGAGVLDGGQLGGQMGAGEVRGQMGAVKVRWGRGKMVGWGEWDTRQEWASSQEWGSIQGMGFHTEMGFQSWDGVPDRGWDTRHRLGSRHGMVGYQTWDDGMSDRGRVTTLTSHQSGILHSLIFLVILDPL